MIAGIWQKCRESMNYLIVVTLQTRSYSKDFELPADQPLGKIYPRVLDALRTDIFPDLGEVSSIVFELNGKGMIDETATLSDYGVCTGAYLSVVSKDKYRGFGADKAI